MSELDNMVPVPEFVTQQISRRAVEIAQIIGPRKTGEGLTSLTPYWDIGVIGMQFPDNKDHMIDLDQGIKEHPMEELAGKIIPVRSPGGTLYFRRASADTIGKVPIINRSAKSGRITDGKPEWMYPAKTGLNFIQRSLQMSVDEWSRNARSTNIVEMLLHTRLKNDVSMVIYGRELA